MTLPGAVADLEGEEGGEELPLILTLTSGMEEILRDLRAVPSCAGRILAVASMGGRGCIGLIQIASGVIYATVLPSRACMIRIGSAGTL